MGKLLGAIAGAGGGLANWATTFQRTEADRTNQQDLARLNDELMGNRARALEQFKVELANSNRTTMGA